MEFRFKMVSSIDEIKNCPACGSDNLIYVTSRDQVVCKDCGMVHEPFSSVAEDVLEISHAPEGVPAVSTERIALKPLRKPGAEKRIKKAKAKKKKAKKKPKKKVKKRPAKAKKAGKPVKKAKKRPKAMKSKAKKGIKPKKKLLSKKSKPKKGLKARLKKLVKRKKR